MNSFDIIRYIAKVMKESGVKTDSISHDTIDRIILIAKRTLNSKSEKMIFYPSGNRWGAGIVKVK